MARTDVVIPSIYEAENYRGTSEILDFYNAKSRGGILLSDNLAKQAAGGEYTTPFRFVTNESLDNRMDHEDTGDATFGKITQTSGSKVRIKRYVAAQIDDDEVDVSALSDEAWSMIVAQQMAENSAITIRDVAVRSALAAVQSMDTPSSNYHIYGSRVALGGSSTTITAAGLNQLVGKMGDAMEQIGCFLMPSIGYLNLVAGQLASGTPDPVSGAVFYGNEPAALGRALMIADISHLQTAADSTYKADHYVLGFGPAAVTVEVVGRDALEIDRDITTELKNTKFRQDYELEVSIAGMKWAPSSTTENPTIAQLATAANWDENLDDHRQCPLVMGIFQTA
jgi:hypothetical protein